MKNITTIAKTYMQHITAARRAEAKDDTRTANREYDAARTYRKMLSDYDETQIFNMVNKTNGLAKSTQTETIIITSRQSNTHNACIVSAATIARTLKQRITKKSDTIYFSQLDASINAYKLMAWTQCIDPGTNLTITTETAAYYVILRKSYDKKTKQDQWVSDGDTLPIYPAATSEQWTKTFEKEIKNGNYKLQKVATSAIVIANAANPRLLRACFFTTLTTPTHTAEFTTWNTNADATAPQPQPQNVENTPILAPQASQPEPITDRVPEKRNLPTTTTQPDQAPQPDPTPAAVLDTYEAERAAILKKYRWIDRTDPKYKSTIHNGRINLRDELAALDARHAAINVTAEFSAIPARVTA